MPTPPTTRASRSRFSTPAVVGGTEAAGARNSNANANGGGSSSSSSSSSRGRDNKDKCKGKGKENNGGGAAGEATASAARPSSTERSRRFMESWIEPERARLTSFQEDGLLRQGVLETMEPLGTRPKPSIIRKLVGMAREGSPTPSARGAGGKKKKIVLKRKKAESSAAGSSPPAFTAAGAATPQALTSPTSTTEETQEQGTDYSSKDAQKDDLGYPAGEHPSRGQGHPLFQSKRSERGTPAPATLTESLPLPFITQQQTSSPTHTPTPKIEQPNTPTFAPLPDPPLLPDPIKQSIEELRLPNLPTTPRSVRSIASTYDSEDDYFKRESSVQSTSQLSMPSKRAVGHAAAGSMRSASPIPDPDHDQAASGSPADPAAQMQQQLGPHYTKTELARIIQHKEQVRHAVDSSVALALEYHHYADAYALRLAYAHNQNNARFLLQAEALYKQLIAGEALLEWALKLKPYKDEGERDHTALKFFVPEAHTDLNFDFEAHKPLQAPYGHLLLIDMAEVRGLDKKRKRAFASQDQDQDQDQSMVQQHVGEGEGQSGQSQETQAEADEAEPERVATPPRKRQKTQQRDSSTARKASTPSASARARARARNMNGASNAAASPPRPKTRAGSNVSDVSSLSSIRTMSPIHEFGRGAAEAAQLSDAQNLAKGLAVEEPDDVQMQNGAGEDGGASGGFGVDAPADAADAAANCSTSSGGLRRAPARSTRNARPNYYIPVPTEDPVSSSSHPPFPQFHSNNISQPKTTNPDPDKQQHSNHSAAATIATTNSPHSAQPNNRAAKKSKKGMPNFASQEPVEPDNPAGPQVKLPTRREARNETERLTKELRTESYTRVEPLRDASPPERPETASSSSSLSSVPDVEGLEPEQEPIVQKGRASGARATRANKRTHDEVEDDASPFSLDFGTNAGTGTGATSRAVTPRPAKKAKTARRVKQSPMKNKAGPAAGGVVPARAGNRVSPSVNGAAPNNQEENDDFCSFCAGNGNLVCCDGCQKAFHYMDHEPVVDPNEDAAWFCWDCMVKRDPSLVGNYKGPFGALMANLDKKHAKAFFLPKKIREYFEGVRTGVDGEYEEFVPPVKGKKKKEAEDKEKPFDYFQIVDKENKPILCHACHESAATRRPIIPCSLCGLWWHADCLDPPKAQPPNHRTFVCPCHVDDLLLKIPAQLGPAHKFRKIKGSSDIVYGFRRGNVNNGYIEVDDDESDGEAACRPIGMRDPDSWGLSYRVRSSGVRDDFISKVGGRKRPRKPQPRTKQLPSADYADDAEDRYEAALNIMAFARKARADRGGGPVNFSSPALGVFDEGQSMYISKRHIEAASPTELEEMEAQLERVSQTIRAEMRKRSGDDTVAESGPPTRRNTTDDPAAEAPNAQAQQQIDLTTVEEVSESGDNHHAWIVLEADYTCNDGSAAETAHAAKNKELVKTVDHQKTPLATDEAAPEPPVDPATNSTDITIQSVASYADKEGMKTGMDNNATVTGVVEEMVDQAVDAALTPISDAIKEANELPSIKTTLNGVETPDTNIPDQSISPVEAERMDLD